MMRTALAALLLVGCASGRDARDAQLAQAKHDAEIRANDAIRAAEESDARRSREAAEQADRESEERDRARREKAAAEAKAAEVDADTKCGPGVDERARFVEAVRAWRKGGSAGAMPTMPESFRRCRSYDIDHGRDVSVH